MVTYYLYKQHRFESFKIFQNKIQSSETITLFYHSEIISHKTVTYFDPK